MEEIKLISMEIKNFKRIKDSGVLLFDGNSIEIRGENETGKSTIADAFFWCLFGKNSNDAKVFSVKPIDKITKEEIHYLETSVEVVLSVNGVEKKFKRIMTENWTSKRGSEDKTYNGNVTEGFINDVPKKITDYQKEVGAVIDEELFKLLTSTTYFNSLHWTKQRDIIFRLVQGVDDTYIINQKQELAPLLAELVGGKSIDDLKAQKSVEMKSYDKKISTLPSEIKTLMEIEYDLPEDFNPEKNQVLLDFKSKKRDELLMQSSSQTKSLKAEEIEQTIYSIKSANRKLETEKEVLLDDAERSKNIALGEIKTKINTFKKSLAVKDEDIKALSDRVIKGQKVLEESLAKRENLIAEFKEIKARVFTTETDTCPTCGSKWSQDKIGEFEKHFNVEKAKAIEKNKENGIALKVEIEKYQKAIEELNNKIKYLEMEKEELSAEIEILEKEVKEIENTELITNTSKIDAQIETNNGRLKLLETELENIEKLSEEDDSTNQIQSELDALQEEIELLSKYKVNYFNDKTRKENIILKEQEKEKAKREYEKANKVMTLIGKFIEFKGQYLADSINRPFKIVKFKLSKTNELAGTIEDTCIATVDGVPFPDVNTGAKIQAGLDIISGLQEIYQVRMPIFIDNAEAVTHWMIDLNCQQIKLYADEKYKTLTFFANGEKQEG